MNEKIIKGPWNLDLEGNGKEIFIEGGGDDYTRLDCRISVDDCDAEAARATARALVVFPEICEALFNLVVDATDQPNTQRRKDLIKAARAALKKGKII